MRYLFTLAFSLFLTTSAVAAGFQGGTTNRHGMGGFQGPNSGRNIATVAQALQAWDDAPVVLTGNIVSHVAGSDDKYMFRDRTGKIMVDIDYKKFAGRDVTPANLVRITGEVDKDRLKPVKIDVKYLEILK